MSVLGKVIKAQGFASLHQNNASTLFANYDGIEYFKGPEPKEYINLTSQYIAWFSGAYKARNTLLADAARKALRRNVKPMGGRIVNLNEVPDSSTLLSKLAADLEKELQKIQAFSESKLGQEITQQIYAKNHNQPYKAPNVDKNAAEVSDFLKAFMNIVDDIDLLNSMAESGEIELSGSSWENIKSRFFGVKKKGLEPMYAFIQRIFDGKATNNDVMTALMRFQSRAPRKLKSTGNKGLYFGSAFGDFAEQLMSLALSEAPEIIADELIDSIQKNMQINKTFTATGGQAAITGTIRTLPGQTKKGSDKKGGYRLADGMLEIKQDGHTVSITIYDQNRHKKTLNGIGVSMKRYNLSKNNAINLGEISMQTLMKTYTSGIGSKGRIYPYRAAAEDINGAAYWLAEKNIQNIIWGGGFTGGIAGPDYTSLILFNGLLMDMSTFVEKNLEANPRGFRVSVSGKNNVTGGSSWWDEDKVPTNIDNIHATKIRFVTSAGAGNIYNTALGKE